ncbi:hypothetical protein G6F68_021297 [Rhizopus microsporus]|nr:hypothetical protein G6F68_021297 [Rhizopus microsporus]KAG1223411.1 hypothetical protein G6F67_009642 [Rhizopus microsporus]KAG1225439.1 hypothetical protein G6F67_009299 [Rhizopus microsporus]
MGHPAVGVSAYPTPTPMVWSAISVAGPGWLCKIDTTMDKELYLSIIQDELARTIDDTAAESGLKVNQLCQGTP